MARKKMNDEWESVAEVKSGKGFTIEKGSDGTFAISDEETGDFIEYVFDSASEAEQYAKQKYNKLSQGDAMDKEKMKKKLMEKEKLSEKEADEKLAKMSDDDQKKLAAEVDEDEKKMTADKDADDKKMAADDEEEAKKLTARRNERLAARKDLVKLAGEIKGGFGGIKLAQKKVAISARLSKLRGAAKVTPAEIKKINLTELAGKSDDALESYFKAFEAREPQVMVGMYGDRNAVEGAELGKKKRLASMEKTVLEGMPFMSEVLKNKRLAAGEQEQEAGQDTVNVHIDTDPHTDMEADAAEIEKMMDIDPGKAKEMLKAYCQKMKGRMTGGGTSEMTEDGEKAVEELASEMKKMQTQNEQLLGLVAKLTGETV